MLISYLRLFGLARERPETPPLDFEGQVVPLLGVSKTQARQHLRDLRLAKLLTWRQDPGGQYIFCFFRISEPQIGFPESEEEDEEISPDLNKPKIHHHLLLPESGFPKTENRNPGAVSAPRGGVPEQGGEGLSQAAVAQVEPGEAKFGAPVNAPKLPGGMVSGAPAVLEPPLPAADPPGKPGSVPIGQEQRPGKPSGLPGSPPAAPGLTSGTPPGLVGSPPAGGELSPGKQPGLVGSPSAGGELSPGAPPGALDLPPAVLSIAHSQSGDGSLSPNRPQAQSQPQARPEWREIPTKPPLSGLPRPKPTHAWQPASSSPGQTRLLSLDAEGRLPSQFNLLIQDPRFNQVMAWLTRSGVWTDTAIRLSRQVLENELRAAPYTPTRADVLGWITFCFAFRSENKITRSSSVLAGNLDANRCCPDELRPKPICLRCRFTADYCECAEGPQADFPPEFFDYAMINAYTPEVEDYWGVCPTCHHYGCLCVERGYAEIAEEETECNDYFDEDEEDEDEEP